MRPASIVNPAVPIKPTAMMPNRMAVAPAWSRKRRRMFRETAEIERFMIWFPLLNHLRRLGAQVATVRRIIVAHDRQIAGIGRLHDGRLPRDHRRQAGGIAGASGTVDLDSYRRLRRSQARRGGGDGSRRRGVG